MYQTYKCYSPRMYSYLISRGIVPVNTGYNSKTDKSYWIYEMDKNLSESLMLWTKRKN